MSNVPPPPQPLDSNRRVIPRQTKRIIPSFSTPEGMELLAQIYDFSEKPEFGGWLRTMHHGKRSVFFTTILPAFAFAEDGFLSQYRSLQGSTLQKHYARGTTYIMKTYPELKEDKEHEIRPEWPRGVRRHAEFLNYIRDPPANPPAPRVAPNPTPPAVARMHPSNALATSTVADSTTPHASVTDTSTLSSIQESVSQMSLLMTGQHFRSVDAITADLQKHMNALTEARRNGASEEEIEVLSELLKHAKSELRARRCLNEQFIQKATGKRAGATETEKGNTE